MMENSQKLIHILKEFQRINPELVSMMVNCDHHFNSDNMSPYHLEKNVWSHVMVMYNNLFRLYHETPDKYNSFIIHTAIAVLCHDIGKVYTRAVPNGQFGKISMYSHNFASVQPTIDFINKLTITGLDKNGIYSILLAVSNHMDFHSIFDKNERLKLCNYDKTTYNISLFLYNLDCMSSMDENLEFVGHFTNPWFWSFDDDFINPNFYEDLDSILYHNEERKTINLYCGCPGSGKDYIANKTLYPTVSYDDIRVNEYLKENPKGVGVLAEVYEKAWKYCNDKNIDLNKHLKEQVESLLKRSNEVNICNTNLTRKARRTLVNLFNNDKYKINIYYVISDSKNIIDRNNKRLSKNLDRLVMNKFIYNQQVPSYFDFGDRNNVSNIELILN